MSKLFEALNKVKEQRRKQSVPSPAAESVPVSVVQEQQAAPRIPYYALTSALFVCVALASIGVNIKTLAELKYAREDMSVSLAQHFKEQKQELAALRQHLEQEQFARKNQEQYVERLEGEIRQAARALVKIEDLKLNDKLMLEKFIALNNQVKQIEDRWEKIENGK